MRRNLLIGLAVHGVYGGRSWLVVRMPDVSGPADLDALAAGLHRRVLLSRVLPRGCGHDPSLARSARRRHGLGVQAVRHPSHAGLAAREHPLRAHAGGPRPARRIATSRCSWARSTIYGSGEHDAASRPDQAASAGPPAGPYPRLGRAAGRKRHADNVCRLAGRGQLPRKPRDHPHRCHGTVRELVLRRWVRPDWQTTDPEFTPQREIAALTLFANADVPAPRLVAADVDAASCDVPAQLETRVPGHPPRPPADLDGFCRQLAAALPSIHAVEGCAATIVPSFRAYVDAHATAPPPWAPSDIWRHAWEVLAQSPPPSPGVFHPPRLPHRQHALDRRPAHCGRRLDLCIIGPGRGRPGPHALEPRPRLRARRLGTLPAPPRRTCRDRPTPALLGHPHHGRPHRRRRSPRSTPRPRPQRPRGPRHTRPPRTRLTPLRCERRAGAP